MLHVAYGITDGGFAQAIGHKSTASQVKGLDIGKWFGQRIEMAAPALRGCEPIEFVATPTGRDVFGRLLGAMESGALQ